MKTTRILGYGCSTPAGRGAPAFWKALVSGTDLSVAHAITDAADSPIARGCFFPARVPSGGRTSEGSREPPRPTTRELLGAELLAAWQEVRKSLDATCLDDHARAPRLGVILATTKGCLEDWVWESAENSTLPETDPGNPLLEDFLSRTGLRPRLSICVSNACASALSALWLAERWLAQDRVDDVLVLACDAAGPFVFRGFQALGALTRERVRPFAAERSGLQLGEAAAAIYLTSREVAAAPARLRGVAIDSEGFAVTRPSLSGESLARVCRAALGPSARPDLVIAHGTGTLANDLAEDHALASLPNLKDIPVTGTKWCVGHTLGASGALDVIAACEALAHGRAFALASTLKCDSALACRYLTQGANTELAPHAKSALVTSLGFGGVHAAAWIEGRK